jgi:type III secretion system TyeA family effector delivery regulator
METRISANNLSSEPRFSGSRRSGVGVGSETGLVVNPDANSEVADAAEELAMSHSEHRGKEIAQREVSCERRLTTVRVQSAETMMQHMRQRTMAERVLQLLQLLRAANQPSVAQILDQTSLLFDDSAEQAAALLLCLELLDGPDDSTGLSQKVREAYIALTGTNPFASDSAAPWQPSEQVKEQLEAFQAIAAQPSADILELLGQLEDISTGKRKIREPLGWMIRAIGAELAGVSGVNDLGSLKDRLDQLFWLAVVAGLQESLEQLETRMTRNFGLRWQIVPRTRRILELTRQSYPTSQQVGQLGDESGIKGVPAAIYFYTEIYRCLRVDLPIKLYSDPHSRDKLLTAAQQRLDDEIAKEEPSVPGQDTSAASHK